MQLSFFLRCVRYIVTESNEARERKEKLERNSWMSWKIKLELCVFSPFAICWRGEESFPFPPLIRTQKIIARSKQQFYGYIYMFSKYLCHSLEQSDVRLYTITNLFTFDCTHEFFIDANGSVSKTNFIFLNMFLFHYFWEITFHVEYEVLWLRASAFQLWSHWNKIFLINCMNIPAEVKWSQRRHSWHSFKLSVHSHGNECVLALKALLHVLISALLTYFEMRYSPFTSRKLLRRNIRLRQF